VPKLTNLEIDETSLCAKGMNQHARVALFKKAPDFETSAVRLSKMCCESERAATMFAEAIEAESKDRAYWKATDDVQPALSAVSASVRSIVADQSLTPESRASMLKESIGQFATAVAGTGGLDAVTAAVEKSLADFSAATLGNNEGDESSARAGENGMTDLEKAQAEIEALKKAQAESADKLAKAEAYAKLSDAAKAHVAKLSKADAEAFMAKPDDEKEAECKKAADLAKAADETLTVGGATIRKSEVGAGAFAVMKAQQAAIEAQAAEIAKAKDEAETAKFEKIAAEQYQHLPGTDVEKAKVLKSLAALPEDVRKTQENILKAAEATAKLAFESRGATYGSPDVAKAAANFTKRVDEIAARDKCAKTVALSKARTEYPAEFEAWQGATDA
jgi:hypothetical protein